LLAGDPTAAPAIARRLEELSETTQAFAVLFDPAGSGGREFSSRAGINVQWTTTEAGFVSTLRQLRLPEEQGFIWCAGEAGLMARLRELFVNERQHPRQAMRISGYWKGDETGFHETLEKGLA
jgi:NADPH-dependent ferric siderophore reductase